MRKTYRLNCFSFYDHTGMEAYLTAQALRGWLVEELGQLFWVFRRTEPQRLTFAVTYYPDGSVYDSVPTEAQDDYRDLAAQTGWRRLCTCAQLQIYCTADPDPVPLETDPAIQLENVRDAAIPGFMTQRLAQGGIALMGLGTAATLTRPDSRYFWQIPGLACVTCLAALLLLHAAADLTAYGLWLRRAQRDADLGRFRPTPTLAALTRLVLLLSAGILAAFLLSQTDAPYWQSTLLIEGFCLGLLALRQGVFAILRRCRAARAVTLFVSRALLAVEMAAVVLLLPRLLRMLL